MADLRPPVGPPSRLFGVAATVTPFGGQPIPTTVSWHPPQVDADTGVRALVAEGDVDLRKRLAIRRDEVPTLLAGSTVIAPRRDGDADESWMVERVDEATDPDFWLAVVS